MPGVHGGQQLQSLDPRVTVDIELEDEVELSPAGVDTAGVVAGPHSTRHLQPGISEIKFYKDSEDSQSSTPVNVIYRHGFSLLFSWLLENPPKLLVSFQGEDLLKSEIFTIQSIHIKVINLGWRLEGLNFVFQVTVSLNIPPGFPCFIHFSVLEGFDMH